MSPTHFRKFEIQPDGVEEEIIRAGRAMKVVYGLFFTFSLFVQPEFPKLFFV